MEKVIKQYVLGADTQNSKLLESVFHDNFQVVALTKDGIRTLNKLQYLDLIKAGQIGGTKRQLEIIKQSENGVIGTAKIKIIGDQVIFNDHLTFIKENDQWVIVSNVTQVVPK